MNVSNWGSQPNANRMGKNKMKTVGGGGGERVCQHKINYRFV